MHEIRLARIVSIIAVFCIAAVASAAAQTLTTLVNFSGPNGYEPVAVIQATDGNFYGVTYYGGTSTSCPFKINCGTVFKMTPGGELTTLHSFCTQSQCSDGYNPISLIQASNGNFYGVTQSGGLSIPDCFCGTIFEITSGGKLTTLYRFCTQTGCSDGQDPNALVQATNGNFYGVAGLGGAHNSGTVFEITPAGVLTTLYNFCAVSKCPDGGGVMPTSLMQSSNKNFYGSAEFGGTHNYGTIFGISPAGEFAVLANLPQPNGVIQAGDDFYGTTAVGGADAGGTFFRMTPAGHVTVLYSFCAPNCATGDYPSAPPVEGSDGNFYGTTFDAGLTYYAGSVYEITPGGTFSTLYLFCSQSNCADGEGGFAIIQATSGDFYGTTREGGTGNDGTVFSLSTGLGPFVAARPNFGAMGQVVTILGNNLTGTTSVTFNGTPATFQVNSAGTSIQAKVPTGATTGTIQVTTPSGMLSSSVPFQIN